MKRKVTAARLWGVIYPMLLYLGITYLLIFVTTIFMTVGYIFKTGVTSEEVITNNILNLLAGQSLLLTFFAAVATMPLLIYFRKKDIDNEKLNGRFVKYKVSITKYILIIPFAVFAMLAANYLVNIITMFMPDFMLDSYTSTAEAIYESNLGIQIIAAVIAGPIVEELIFRGLVYDRVKRMSSIIPAAIISALAFGIFHGNWVQAPYAFIIGLVCVFVYEKYKNMAAPILLHISANLASVVISSWASAAQSGASDVQMSTVQEIIITVLCFIITGAIAVALGVVINNFVKAKRVND